VCSKRPEAPTRAPFFLVSLESEGRFEAGPSALIDGTSKAIGEVTKP